MIKKHWHVIALMLSWVMIVSAIFLEKGLSGALLVGGITLVLPAFYKIMVDDCNFW